MLKVLLVALLLSSSTMAETISVDTRDKVFEVEVQQDNKSIGYASFMLMGGKFPVPSEVFTNTFTLTNKSIEDPKSGDTRFNTFRLGLSINIWSIPGQYINTLQITRTSYSNYNRAKFNSLELTSVMLTQQSEQVNIDQMKVNEQVVKTLKPQEKDPELRISVLRIY